MRCFKMKFAAQLYPDQFSIFAHLVLYFNISIVLEKSVNNISMLDYYIIR